MSLALFLCFSIHFSFSLFFSFHSHTFSLSSSSPPPLPPPPTAPTTMSASAYNYETVKVSFPAEFVAHVELNRPKKLNAINDTMWTDIGAVFNQLRDDENVRAIVLSGSGRCFTSGLDRTSCRFPLPLRYFYFLSVQTLTGGCCN